MGWMAVRLLLSLVFVGAVMYFAARLAKKRGLGRGTALVEVLARQPLNRVGAVTVVRVADRVFMLGTTESQVSLLAELDETVVNDALEESDVTLAPSASVSRGLVAGSVFDRGQWSSLVQGMRDKTVRR